jgi:TonB family protein
VIPARLGLVAACALLVNVALAQATRPKVIEQHPPAYPPAEEAARHGGRVAVRVDLNQDGAVENVEVIKSTGYTALDQAAIDAVKKWRFAPATDEQGKPAAGSLSFALNFKPPLRELDFVSTCAQVNEQVAALRAAAPDAGIDQVPAYGAIKDLAETMDEVLPAEHRGVAQAALPRTYSELQQTCARKPQIKFHEAYDEVMDVSGKARK